METPIYLLHLLYFIVIYIISIISLSYYLLSISVIYHHKCGIISSICIYIYIYYTYTIYILYLSSIYEYIIHCVHCLKPWNQMILENMGGGMWQWAGCVTGCLLLATRPLLKPKNKEHNTRLAFNLAHMKSSRISLLQIKTEGFQVTFLQSNNHVCW